MERTVDVWSLYELVDYKESGLFSMLCVSLHFVFSIVASARTRRVLL